MALTISPSPSSVGQVEPRGAPEAFFPTRGLRLPPAPQ
jgi:hypothetical protein